MVEEHHGKKWISFKGNFFVSFFLKLKKKINLKRITSSLIVILLKCLQKIILKKLTKNTQMT